MVIEKVLEISTGHLPQHVWDEVHRLDWPRLLMDEYGAFFWTPIPGDGCGYDLPPELFRVLKYARSIGCRWVSFDRDADQIKDLPYWDF